MAVRDAPLEPARCWAGRNRTSEAGDLGFPAGGGGFGIGEEGWEGHWEKRRRVRCEEKQPGDGDSGSTINGCSSQQATRGPSSRRGHRAKKEKILWFGWGFRCGFFFFIFLKNKNFKNMCPF